MDAKPIVKFRTKDGHYHADAAVVWCFDDRFYKLLKKFGKKQGFGHIDLVKVAGGAKALAVHAEGASPEVLVVACPDPRFYEAIHEFLHRKLGLAPGQYLFLGEFGGVLPLVDSPGSPDPFRYVRARMSFSFSHFHRMRRFVGFNHPECARYRARHRESGASFLKGHTELHGRQVMDLVNAPAIAARIAGRPLASETYQMVYANEEHTRVRFRRIR